MTMISYTKNTTSYDAPSCQPLTGGWGKASHSSAITSANEKPTTLNVGNRRIPSSYGNSTFSAKRIAIFLATMALCLHVASGMDSAVSVRRSSVGSHHGFAEGDGKITNSPTKMKWGFLFKSKTFWTAVACTCLFLCAMLFTFEDGNMILKVINQDNGASVFARLGVIIPTGLFVVGAIGGGIYRFQDFLDYRKPTSSEVSWKEYKKLEMDDETTNTIHWALFGWFATAAVCALVLIIVGIATNVNVEMANNIYWNEFHILLKPIFSVTLGLVGVGGGIGATIVFNRRYQSKYRRLAETATVVQDDGSSLLEIALIVPFGIVLYLLYRSVFETNQKRHSYIQKREAIEVTY